MSNRQKKYLGILDDIYHKAKKEYFDEEKPHDYIILKKKMTLEEFRKKYKPEKKKSTKLVFTKVKL